MAKLFAITLPAGLSTLQLDSQGRGTVHYSVKSVCARPMDARAVLVSLPQGNPADPNNAVQKGWIKIDGKAERHFEINGEDTFTVNVLVPPKSAPGSYSYRLDVVSVAKPDEGDSSQPTKFTVVETPTTKPKWGLIAAIAALVIVVAGIGIALALRPKTPAVPNLVGMTASAATTALTSAHLQLSPTQLQVPGSASNVGLVVAQSPAAGATATPNSTVQISVGVAQTVTVPSLSGMTVAQALQALSPNLTLGTQTPLAAFNPSFAVGAITSQTPPPTSQVIPNTPINVTINPPPIAVVAPAPAPVRPPLSHW